MRTGARRALAGGLWLALLALASCTDIGESGVDAELDRIQGERGFAVSSVGPDRTVFLAQGRRVVVEPPPGYCLDTDAVRVTRRSAFALIADCLSDQQAQVALGAGSEQAVAINLPRSFPGIMTVSISGDSALGADPQALDAFEELLRSDAGRLLLNRGNNGGAGTIAATRRAGRALYVLIDEAAGHVTFLSPRFWRGFIEINGRLVLVTVSGFSDRPIAADAMLGFLAAQMARLRRANGMEADADEDGIAGQLALAFADVPATGVEVVHSKGDAVTEDGIAPGRSPRPPSRGAPARTAGASGAHVPMPPPRAARAAGPAATATSVATPRTASAAAPVSAPIAPKRRR